jgi:hypothetical protein
MTSVGLRLPYVVASALWLKKTPTAVALIAAMKTSDRAIIFSFLVSPVNDHTFGFEPLHSLNRFTSVSLCSFR